jgi:polysaccharide export outer membrane protein
MTRVVRHILVFSLLAISSFSASAQEKGYKIGPGDALEISVWKDEALSRQLIVPPDGMIAFPLIGDIDASDLTIPQLREMVTQRLSEYVPDATVTAMLVAANSLTAHVIGKVNRPGQYPITLETNVMKILAMAGGLNPYASPNKIIILRQEEGIDYKIPFRYGEVEKGDNLKQNILLRRGDVVVVP